nr:MAG TPA: DNA polymerase III, alpha subunit [Caudoviricetes sp.]
MFDLHRHDEYSTFDGYGKATELAALAKEYGYKSLCTTNHGNTNGLIQTYMACKDAGIKSILGVEGYFLPKWKQQVRGFHLIVIAKNLKGYGNMNRLQFEGEKQKYYNPIWDFDLLEKYHEGLICTTACVASYSSQCIIAGKNDLAEKYLRKLKDIFCDDLYIEIQPYKVSEEGLQEYVNVQLIKLAKKLRIKCILTSDSHRGRKEDFDTYMKMHEVANHNFADIEATYAERYMPKPFEMQKRFYKMHKNDFGDDMARKLANKMAKNLDEIEEKCEENYLEQLPLKLPKLGDDSTKVLKNKIIEGLKRRGKYKNEYIKRVKEEFNVIHYHGFEDYFLIVADYVNWAKKRGIIVGPGRGSVCNCLVAYAIGITEVDSLLFNLDFRRFLRKDKKKFPDIDLDFETSRRHEVIEYLCKKYEGHAARICSYGLYRVDNLLNDLFKVCGLPIDKTLEEEEIKRNKSEIQYIKSFVQSNVDENNNIDIKNLIESAEAKIINKKYDNILIHFCKLYKKVRFIGTHAAGVAITGGELLDYVALKIDKNGDVFTNYDLTDIETVNVIKFDILGLKTMESIGDLRKSTGITINYDEAVKDKKILENFRLGNCDGIFQFEKKTARDILEKIHCDCFDDIVAASSMNRPGPLSLKQPDLYAENKYNIEEAKTSEYWEYAKESFGTIIYQEQVQQICISIGNLSWGDADRVMKMMKGGHMTDSARKTYEKDREDLLTRFVSGAVENGYDEGFANDLFEKMTTYTFNKGHGVGYSLISVEEMFYKVYEPSAYWFAKLKYAKNDSEYDKFCAKAVKDGSVVFLPHANYSSEKAKLRKVEGEDCLQQGLSEIKGVGEKAASYILEERKKHGIFTSFDNFYDRCKSRTVTSRVIELLKEAGALEFNKKIYIKRVIKYNSALYSRANS